MGFKFLETSAKKSLNVEEAFICMTKEIKSRAKVIDDSEDTSQSTNSGNVKRRTIKTTAVSDNKRKKKSGCC